MPKRGSLSQRRSWRRGFEEKQEGAGGRVAQVLGEDGQLENEEPEYEEHAGEGEGGELEGGWGEHLLYAAVGLLLVDRQVVCFPSFAIHIYDDRPKFFFR